MARRKRGAELIRDLILTLGVIGVFIAFLMVVAPHSATPFAAVDYETQLTQARQVAPYHVLAPQGLSPAWKANNAVYNGADPTDATWHLGFVTPADQYAAVDQTDGAGPPFVATTTENAVPAGQVSVGGVTWERYTGKETGLVTVTGNVTTIVSGTAGMPELTALAAALR